MKISTGVVAFLAASASALNTAHYQAGWETEDGLLQFLTSFLTDLENPASTTTFADYFQDGGIFRYKHKQYQDAEEIITVKKNLSSNTSRLNNVLLGAALNDYGDTPDHKWYNLDLILQFTQRGRCLEYPATALITVGRFQNLTMDFNPHSGNVGQYDLEYVDEDAKGTACKKY